YRLFPIGGDPQRQLGMCRPPGGVSLAHLGQVMIPPCAVFAVRPRLRGATRDAPLVGGHRGLVELARDRSHEDRRCRLSPRLVIPRDATLTVVDLGELVKRATADARP